ncbi:MAG: PEP-utilizing enzyme [Acidimicrobiia bacterium]|nr:PEP-utilizing enzyme [Acidimicrobiia bacterium]
MADLRWIEDNELSEKWPFWTRANVGEVLPEPPSPLGWDLVWEEDTLAGWYDCAVDRMGYGDVGMNPRRPEVAGMFGGYAYLCATGIRLFGVRTPGMTAEDIDLAYFGDHPDVPPYVHEDWHDSAEGTAMLAGWLGWVMGTMEQDELEADRLDGLAARESRPDLTMLTDAELLARARSFKSLVRRMFNQHINQSGAASVGPGVIGTVCAALGQPTTAMKLFAGLGGVDSAAPSYAMWELSRQVRSSSSLTTLFDLGVVGLANRIRRSEDPAAAAFSAGLDAFLASFGSRGPNEWDIHAHTWETDPDLALAAIDRMRLAGDDTSPLVENEVREQERERLSAELVEALAADPETQGQFQAALASAKVFVPGRERSKTTIIRVIHEVRMAVWELGRRAVAAGHVDEPRDICLLFEDELERAIAGELDGIREIVAQRQAHHDWLRSLEPPFIINGAVPANTEWPKRGESSVDVARSGDSLVGNPGCPGVYRGRARVVLDPSDPTVLKPGDVLVAPMTDPAWTPLFVTAGAVVVDVGAALSHAIIVSRELGIPCVVSATDATRKIRDGAEIEVDGSTGVVTLL